MAKKILERQIEGLVWNNEPKKIDVAYGIQKLQMGCVIEDAKVLTDDIFEPIEAWEEVQSVDMVSMQKLWFTLQLFPSNIDFFFFKMNKNVLKLKILIIQKQLYPIYEANLFFPYVFSQ